MARVAGEGARELFSMVGKARCAVRAAERRNQMREKQVPPAERGR